MNEEMNLTHLGLDAINSPMGMPIWKLAPERRLRAKRSVTVKRQLFGVTAPPACAAGYAMNVNRILGCRGEVGGE